jgi:hypothetical protein
MKRTVIWVLLAGASALAGAQTAPLTLRDIEDKKPRTLTKDELTQLLPGAKMSRVSANGNNIRWSNDSGGSFVASSDNMGGGGTVIGGGRPSTASGKWHISDDGRYCVLIEWRGVPTEEWCRYVLETTDGYYMAKSTKVGNETVFKYGIKK